MEQPQMIEISGNENLHPMVHTDQPHRQLIMLFTFLIKNGIG
jgi:hypothetical protein